MKTITKQNSTLIGRTRELSTQQINEQNYLIPTLKSIGNLYRYIFHIVKKKCKY